MRQILINMRVEKMVYARCAEHVFLNIIKLDILKSAMCYVKYLEIIIMHTELYQWKKKKDSSQYLGIYINERILKHVMPNAVLMDNNNPGYDLVCGKGYLVDAKAAVASHYKENTCKWMFGIRQNKIPDYFLLTAYKDRTTLEIVHMWLIPGIQLNDKQTISISSSTIEKWNDWKIDHTDALNCISKIGEIQ